MLQHLVDVEEKHLKALATRFLAKSLGDVGFSDAGWAADQQIALLADVVTGGQGQ